MCVDIGADGIVVLKRKKRLNEVVHTYADKKVVKIAADDGGDELYEHIGVGKGGIEWHTGVFVIEKCGGAEE